MRTAARIGVVAMLAGVVGCAPQPAAPKPVLRLVAESSSVTLDRYDERGVVLDLDTHVVADHAPLELRVTRKSYADPIVASQRLGQQRKALPAELVADFTGLPGFVRLTVSNAAGKPVLTKDQTWCPNNRTVRRRPNAPDSSPYPPRCTTNPFALGGVWGIQAGWSAAVDDLYAKPVDLPDGRYTARVSIADGYRTLLDIPPERASATLAVTVRTAPAKTREPDQPAQLATLRPNPTPPTGPATVPDLPRPDLRSLPAGAMTVVRGVVGTPTAAREFLTFFATVWNAGPAPVLVDGFRRAGTDVMDAYQYFYDANGRQVGHAPAGVMEWDLRDGHHHWHFADFARYRLLDSAHREVARSEKTGFCLAAVDAIDITIPHANWQPANTDLRQSCGGHDVVSMRQRLDVGSGDTYQQHLPGQSFDITDLPNGTYHVEVTANPLRHLYETDTSNNVSLRQIVLGGAPGARTVTVPPYHLVRAP